MLMGGVISIMTKTEFRSFSYSVLNFVTDELRQTSVPVGLILWGTEAKTTRIHVASERDNLRGLKEPAYAFIQLVKRKIENWLNEGKLPYASPDVLPNTETWWRHVSKLLVHRIRMSEPRAIDCLDVDREGELLYEPLVLPGGARQQRHDRIDRELSRTLGDLANKLSRGSIVGFRGRAVPVKRFKEGGGHIVIVEGVNLAASSAERDTDALVSKLQRIQEANGAASVRRDIKTFVGSLASPGGLNGESALVEWIQQKGVARTFDLVRRQQSFVSEVAETVHEMEQ